MTYLLPRAGIIGQPAGQLSGAPTCKGSYDVTGNMSLISSAIHTQKNDSPDYPQFGHAPSKIFRSPFVDQKV